VTYDHWKTTEPDWLQQDQGKDHAMTDDDPSPALPPPTQYAVEALSRELMEAQGAAMAGERRDLLQRAALMIARLERAWLEAKSK
jgi:hypothetical protein